MKYQSNPESELFQVIIKTNKFIINKLDKNKTFEIKRTNKFKRIYVPINNSIESIRDEKEIFSQKCFGIIGLFKSIKTDYLILISNAEYIGDIFNSKIFKIKKVKYKIFKNKMKKIKK
jgi:hypothetical protein